MEIVVYTTSRSFKSFINGVFEQRVKFSSILQGVYVYPHALHLLHITSFEDQAMNWIRENADADCPIAVCSDQPGIKQMLDCVQSGVRAYCNSYMQTQYYQQLLRLLSNGQSWFPPHLLEQVFSLAHNAVNGNRVEAKLEVLTDREKQVALSVSDGLSNRQIANQFDISERTVKTHLTNIFKKLQVKDRVGLVLHLK